MCLDNQRYFEFKKKIGYKIYQLHKYNKYLCSPLFGGYYEVGRTYVPKLQKILKSTSGPVKFEYPAGFHVFPYKTNVIKYIQPFKGSIISQKFVMATVEFDNIITRGYDAGVKCLVVDSIKILSYKPLKGG